MPYAPRHFRKNIPETGSLVVCTQLLDGVWKATGVCGLCFFQFEFERDMDRSYEHDCDGVKRVATTAELQKNIELAFHEVDLKTAKDLLEKNIHLLPADERAVVRNIINGNSIPLT